MQTDVAGVYDRPPCEAGARRLRTIHVHAGVRPLETQHSLVDTTSIADSSLTQFVYDDCWYCIMYLLYTCERRVVSEVHSCVGVAVLLWCLAMFSVCFRTIPSRAAACSGQAAAGQVCDDDVSLIRTPCCACSSPSVDGTWQAEVEESSSSTHPPASSSTILCSTDLQFKSSGHDVTGGIGKKVEEAAAIAKLGIPVLIAKAGTASGHAACMHGPWVSSAWRQQMCGTRQVLQSAPRHGPCVSQTEVPTESMDAWESTNVLVASRLHSLHGSSVSREGTASAAGLMQFSNISPCPTLSGLADFGSAADGCMMDAWEGTLVLRAADGLHTL